MKKNFLLFDLDGTLVDSAHDITSAFAHAVATLRPGVDLAAGDVSPHVGWPLVEMARRLELGLSAAEEPVFETTYRARFDALSSGRTRPFPGIPALLERLRVERGATLAVVTAKIAYQADAVVRATDLLPHLAHVQGWSPGLASKPAPDLLHAALEALGASASDAVYVGDTVTDVRAGRAAGMETIAVTWGFGEEDDLVAEKPTGVARSVGELGEMLARG